MKKRGAYISPGQRVKEVGKPLRDAEGGVPYKDTPVSSPPVGSQWTWLDASL